MLLPLTTDRYTNIVQSDTMLDKQNSGYNASEKHNYKHMIKNELSRAVNYAEDNSVPIYDLNFTFLESINLSNYDNCIAFLEEHDLLNLTIKDNVNDIEVPLTNMILFDSNTGKLNSENSDSILIKPLLETLINTPSKFGVNDIQKIMQDLISKLDINSSLRFLSPIGNITKLNSDVISAYCTDEILRKDFINENIFDINKKFTETQENILTPEVLPQNAILNMDLRYPLTVDPSLKDKFYNKSILPSGYFNIAFMKNNRNPHYNINYKYSDSKNLYDYEIRHKLDSSILLDIKGIPLNNMLSGIVINQNTNAEETISGAFNIDVYSEEYINSNSDLIINAYNEHDVNLKNEFYDIDATHSFELNCNSYLSGFFHDLNKSKTRKLINYAAEADGILASADINYFNRFPQRMQIKLEDYLEPYKNYHIANNKLYNLGEVTRNTKLY